MSTQIATEIPVVGTRPTWRARSVGALGPLTVAGGAAWGIFQPYRVTLLHPFGQGFWWLLVQPPLLVILVGVLFHVFVARGLIDDLESASGEQG
jgi:hypothetical protein